MLFGPKNFTILLPTKKCNVLPRILLCRGCNRSWWAKKNISSMRCAMMFRDWLWPNSINSFCLHGFVFLGVSNHCSSKWAGTFFLPAICSLWNKNILSWFVPQCGRQSSRCVSCVPIAIESWTNNSAVFRTLLFWGPTSKTIQKHRRTVSEMDKWSGQRKQPKPHPLMIPVSQRPSKW